MAGPTPEAKRITRADVLRAMRAVPRQRFVPPDQQAHARSNEPLPIGFGQTISQPSLVAYMIELLELRAGDRVLEVGTGSGYQTALLAELGVEVYSIEIIPELASQAAGRLSAAHYAGVHLKQGDGYYGWAAHAPFDAIVVSAAPDHVPPALVEQLAEGGRLVIPVGGQSWGQVLRKYVKRGGELRASQRGRVAFVPFTGEGAQRQERPGAGESLWTAARRLWSLIIRRR